MNKTKKWPMLKCRMCDTRITQDEADEAASIVGPGYETLCRKCAESLGPDDMAVDDD